MSERRGDGVWGPDAEAAERAGVHVGAGFEADPGKAEKIAAVCDGDVVRFHLVAEGLEDRARIDAAVRAGRVACRRIPGTVAMPLPEALSPGPVGRWRPVSGRCDHGA